MAQGSDTVSIVALAIALAALVIAVGQILQQYLGTADGYRRCQASSIGPWSKKTKRHFHWRQFRFEVKFSTPHISLSSMRFEKDEQEPFVPSGVDVVPKAWRGDNVAIALGGTNPSRAASFCRKLDDHIRNDNWDLVGWISFLDRVHDLQQTMLSQRAPGPKETAAGRFLLPLLHESTPSEDPLSMPSITMRRRSWDLMPPDLLRPLASSTVGDIVVIAHRLGMNWLELKYSQGVMHAEGNGQTLTGSMVRGFGIVLQYTHDKQFSRRTQRQGWRLPYIPSVPADKMGFGFIPCERLFGGVDIPLASDNESLSGLLRTLSALGVREDARNFLNDEWEYSRTTHGIADIVAVMPPFLPIPGTTVTNVRPPLHDCWGPLMSREGRIAFGGRLAYEISSEKGSRPHLRELLNRFNDLARQFEAWISGPSDNLRYNCRSLALLHALRENHLWTTRYLSDQFQRHQTSTLYLPFHRLVAAHLSVSPIAYNEAIKRAATTRTESQTVQSSWSTIFPEGEIHRQRNHQMVGRLVPESSQLWLFEMFHQYVDRIHLITDFMVRTWTSDPDFEKIPDDHEVFVDMWWTLMFRGLCWGFSVDFIPSERDFVGESRGMIVPSALWGSGVPVYIA